MTSTPTRPSEEDAGVKPGDSSLLRLTAAVLRRWRFVAVIALLAACGTAVWSLLVPPRYTAELRFAPEERPSGGLATNLPGGLAGIAAQFGVGTDDGSRLLPFYADVLTGQSLLEQLARDSFPNPREPGRSRLLLEILNRGGASAAVRLHNTVEFLRRRAIVTSVNDRTGTLTLSVTMPSADLAADVANALYALLERFNYETRRTSASERRRFAERELPAARDSLEAAENAMQRFLEANRSGAEQPRLRFQAERLQRRIDIRQQVYLTLNQEYQQARMAEVRDIPVFTVVQRAEPPVERAFPRRTRSVVVSLILGAAAAVAWVVFRATGWSAARLDPAGYEEIRTILRRH